MHSEPWDNIPSLEEDLELSPAPDTEGEWELRFARIKRIASLAVPEADKIRILREGLNDFHPSVRYAAVIALRNFNGPEVEDALLFALSDSDEWVRIRAVEGLGQKKAPRAMEAFVQYLDSEKYPKVKATLVKHLGSFKEEKLIPIIASYLNDPDSRVRANAVEGLGFFPTSQVAALLKPFLKDENTRMRANVAVVLSRQEGDENAMRTLEDMVTSSDDHVRVGAIYSMGELRDPKYVTVLLNLLSDASFVIHRNVRDAIVKFGTSVQGILLKEIRSTSNSRMILGAVQVLKEIGDRKALKTLLKIRESGDGELRSAAEEAMDEIVLRTARDRS
ncbi:MAG: HEAT repeat domain-containing protein [Candidatus Cloacimonetes bacterium]|nr:HEAT repeat domain-containing protein [Candidatus Cloacimonadota bacterium]